MEIEARDSVLSRLPLNELVTRKPRDYNEKPGFFDKDTFRVIPEKWKYFRILKEIALKCGHDRQIKLLDDT